MAEYDKSGGNPKTHLQKNKLISELRKEVKKLKMKIIDLTQEQQPIICPECQEIECDDDCPNPRAK